MQNSFDENNQKEVANFVLKNLPRHKQFALGTSDQQNHPWVVCLNFTFDDELSVIWKSKKDAEHSKHIEDNSNVSICVYSDVEGIGDFGFYTKAIAEEVTSREVLSKFLDFRFMKKGKEIPPISDFLDNSDYRIYIARIKEAWVNDNRHLKIKINMDILRSIFKASLN